MNRKERRKFERESKNQKPKMEKSEAQTISLGGGFMIAEGAKSPFPQFEGTRAVLVNGAIYLLSSFPDPHPFDVGHWNGDDWSFGLAETQGQAVIYSKISHLYNEVFINLNIEPKESQEIFLRPLVDDESYFFNFCLINSRTNRIESFRIFGLSVEFNRELQSIFKKQVMRKTLAQVDISQVPAVNVAFEQCLIKEKIGGVKT